MSFLKLSLYIREFGTIQPILCLSETTIQCSVRNIVASNKFMDILLNNSDFVKILLSFKVALLNFISSDLV